MGEYVIDLSFKIEEQAQQILSKRCSMITDLYLHR
jgi:hypothetical protein